MARKILLADDSVTAQNMGRKILADAGYEVITVNNGSAALKRVSEQRPDVIVLDVYMPGYSGLEVCQRLKEVGETARIPILLTVGKLEPFKPEEVKRVRADAFIVKPFEASELLSALSKLEDRIVPRAQESKPGRFGKAAMDQVPYDKTMAIEEDTTWKNRIAFPSKKKSKEPEPDEPVETQSSKDLQSVIEKKLAETPAAPVADTPGEDQRVDLGALAPAGLPKDVTPEEIAALAAAAAQMQGRILDGRHVPAPPTAEPSKVEAKEEPKASEPPKVEAVVPPVTEEAVAETKPGEQEDTKEADIQAPASFADQTLANAYAEQASNKSPASSGNGSWPQTPERPADEPVTMAVASVAAPTPHSSRWTAVAVTLAPEDAAISLEQEMQQASAAFVAAEHGQAATKVESATSDQKDLPVEAPEPAIAAPAAAAEVVQPVASAAAETVSATVKNFEAVASSAPEKNPIATELKSEVSEPPVAPVEKSVEPSLVTPSPVSEPAVEAESFAAKHPANREDFFVPEKSEDPVPVAETKNEPVSAVASEHSKDEDEHQKPDLAAATSAAWEALQKLQGADHGNGSEAPSALDSKPADTAAKAVAVGAESHPEDVSQSDADSDSVASIVDSVLADLRPKIVAEISKKLGKKK